MSDRKEAHCHAGVVSVSAKLSGALVECFEAVAAPDCCAMGSIRRNICVYSRPESDVRLRHSQPGLGLRTIGVDEVARPPMHIHSSSASPHFFVFLAVAGSLELGPSVCCSIDRLLLGNSVMRRKITQYRECVEELHLRECRPQISYFGLHCRVVNVRRP